jgi:hypothetical protein
LCRARWQDDELELNDDEELELEDDEELELEDDEDSELEDDELTDEDELEDDELDETLELELDEIELDEDDDDDALEDDALDELVVIASVLDELDDWDELSMTCISLLRSLTLSPEYLPNGAFSSGSLKTTYGPVPRYRSSIANAPEAVRPPAVVPSTSTRVSLAISHAVCLPEKSVLGSHTMRLETPAHTSVPKSPRAVVVGTANVVPPSELIWNVTLAGETSSWLT